MANFSKMKMGKLPAKFDPRTYKLTAPLQEKLPVPPASINWAPDVQWPMWNNDTIGCCTQVSVASAIRVWTGKSATSPVLLTDQEVLQNYSAESGYVPGDASTDNGGVEVDVLNRWKNIGYCSPKGTDKILSFGYVHPKDHDSIKRIVAMLGGAYIGIQLPNFAVSGDVQTWDLDPQGDNSIAGGHAVFIHGYDDKNLYLNTWGQAWTMTWAFFDTFVEESYGIISQDWINAKGETPEGETLEELNKELTEAIS